MRRGSTSALRSLLSGDVRSQGRTLHAALLHHAGVLVPAGAVAHRHRRDLCLVVLAAPALVKVHEPPSWPWHVRAAARCSWSPICIAHRCACARRRRSRACTRTLARLPRGPVIELPFWSENVAYHRHAEYMLLSTAHWQPLVNGYSDHIPQDFRDNALPLSGFPSRDSFAILEKIGARYAVFHLNLMGADRARARRQARERLPRLPAAAGERRRRVVVRNRRVAQGLGRGCRVPEAKVRSIGRSDR